MRFTILAAILMAFALSACDSPVTEGNYDVPEKDFESYSKEIEILRNSNNSSSNNSN
ncbi:MAG: hypothetical protein Q8K59_06085 [Nitrosomonas sp.]|nr:hypothetical protein [Nitrosomonas sp.]MDP1950652.1 hypothetical protein [Nitrosomonas sp.]